MEREINILDSLVIGNLKQWILIRGRSLSNPVLLLLQGGPGLPMISEADPFENKLKLEEHFTVVYWDQRGCGKTFTKNTSVDSMNLNQMVSDTNELTEHLKQKLNKEKIYIAGFSLGASISLITASRFPQNYISVILVGPDIVMEEAEIYAYNFAMTEAAKTNNKKAIIQLKRIGPPPHLTSRSFTTRVKWVVNFGGISANETYNSIFLKTIKNLFNSSHYSLKDIFKTIQGISFSQKYLLPGLLSLNLFELAKTIDTKVYFIQGINDAASSPDLVKKYFEYLNAPKGKSFSLFNNSAHMPHFEEPGKFMNILIKEVKENSGT